MSIKLTDTQLVMLSAAAQREDRCIVVPPSLKGAAAQKIATKLVAAGLAKEIKAKPGAHVWRCDDANGQAYALKLTAAGLKAIAVEDAEAIEGAAGVSPTASGEVPKNTRDHEAAAGSVAPATAIAWPREGSKLAAVVVLLRREGGATIDQLADAMGWLPHTTRAALTGLRKRGFGIDRRKAKDERAGAYVIVDGRLQRKGEGAMRKTLRSGSIETERRALPETAGSIRTEVPRTAIGLEAELAELERLSLDDLRLRWRNHWGRLAPAPLARGLLFRVMAYRLQAEAFGDLNRKTIRMLDRLADDAADKFASNSSSTPGSDDRLKSEVSPARAASDPLILKPGAFLIREWQGRIERVTVVGDGFAWNGATYASLSAVAFAITGTKWNGHRFFGVRRRDRIGPREREGDAKRSNGGERSSALARGKADNQPRAARGSSSPFVSATTDAGEGIQ